MLESIPENTKLDILPIEIINHILYIINYPYAIKIIQRCFRKYIIYKIRNIDKIIKICYRKMNFTPHMSDYHIFYHNFVYSNKDILRLCNACNCCKRHKKNKPNVFKFWNDYNLSSTPIMQRTCSCSCRHISRFICRAAYNAE